MDYFDETKIDRRLEKIREDEDKESCLISACAKYLAVDGSHGVFDAMRLAEARESIVDIIGISAIREAQKFIYPDR